MHDYGVHELPALIEASFPVSDQRGISDDTMQVFLFWLLGFGVAVIATVFLGRRMPVQSRTTITTLTSRGTP